MKKIALLFFMVLLSTQLIFAQRYVTEVFDDVDMTTEMYGANATVLLLGTVGEAVPQPLMADIYTPQGDTETSRPLIIFFHTGNFLPPQFNGGCGGTRGDADVVEMAKKMARMGYVTACVDYRLGWDPTNPDQTIRVATIINASYRGLQDSRTAVKYFRRTVVDAGNPHGIDDSKIVLWGFGTGAYVTYGSATVQAAEDTWIPPFVTDLGPMVIPQVNGDVGANTVGVVPPNFPGFPPGDTLCYPNHVGYDDSFNLAVQMGGANGHLAWVDNADADVPMISYHVTTDPFAPYNTGLVNVPPPVNLPVVEVSGAGDIIPAANALGIQDALAPDFSGGDDFGLGGITDYANSVNGGNEGLFPFFSNDPTESAPWNFAYSAEPYGVEGSDCPLLDDNITSVRDTVVSYFVPRACAILGLGCTYVSVDNLEDEQVGLTLAPNPASDAVFLQTTVERMQEIVIMDATGKIVDFVDGINDYNYTIQRGNLPAGMYVAMLKFNEGFISKKFFFN